jgi:hypothetical protein
MKRAVSAIVLLWFVLQFVPRVNAQQQLEQKNRVDRSWREHTSGDPPRQSL